jgi:hypothetical protein
MSWLFSQALVEEYSAGTSLAGQPSAQLNVMPTQHKFSYRGKTTDHSSLSRFGLTCVVLTGIHGMELLMSFLAGSHARTLAAPAKALDSAGPGLGCGRKWPASWAKYDHATCSWKTAQCSLLEGSESFSETWPRSGSMRNGACYPLPTLELPMYESASGSLLPTPTLVSCEHPGRQKIKSHQQDCISAALARRDGWLPSGKWSPSHAAWCMGWLESWTSLGHLETGKFLKWQQQHGGF